MIEDKNKICNTNNFFECDKNEVYVFFYGLDIKPKLIKITEKVGKIMKDYNIPYDEFIEIHNDETYRFYQKVYCLLQ